MNRRSRSISPRRYRNGTNSGGGGGYRRYSRSRSRSRERSRDQSHRRRNSRSRSRDRNYRRGSSNEKDLYRDIINSDYQDDRTYGYSRGGSSGSYRSRNDDNYNDDRCGDNYGWNERSRDKSSKDYDRDYERDRKRQSSSNNGGGGGGGRRYNSTERDRDSDESDDNISGHFYNKTPSNTIIVLGLQSHITEADIMSALIQMGMSAASIRLIRKRTTGRFQKTNIHIHSFFLSLTNSIHIVINDNNNNDNKKFRQSKYVVKVFKKSRCIFIILLSGDCHTCAYI
ncbi:uncharacterized protein ACN427_005916 isoform 1-T1 [Glossina fuscipes fuscipes]